MSAIVRSHLKLEDIVCKPPISGPIYEPPIYAPKPPQRKPPERKAPISGPGSEPPIYALPGCKSSISGPISEPPISDPKSPRISEPPISDKSTPISEHRIPPGDFVLPPPISEPPNIERIIPGHFVEALVPKPMSIKSEDPDYILKYEDRESIGFDFICGKIQPIHDEDFSEMFGLDALCVIAIASFNRKSVRS
ncbi:hypothetical protein CCACVL1_15449 [Corchorus capsularis]|uniref:Uncharacterized protein n=1 Tax=Corchorus capsularis TaxID=210143 RepID=A0A1R3I2C8_COCAP|nr:hypothetical protein CCACVL1_15449 [Corchorus capsularis]